jgi:radical SAM-linked protein
LLIESVTVEASIPLEPRQRWRLTFRRDPVVGDGSSSPLDAWVEALDRGRLPFARAGARPKIALAAPLPAAMSGERELLDVFLTERLPITEVRNALEGLLPEGHAIVDLHDVWLGEPALPGQVAAADYRVDLAPGAVDADRLMAACDRLLTAQVLERTRTKGGKTSSYDLRPLIAELAVAGAGAPLALQIGTRFDPSRGAGRPEEVVAALGEVLGVALEPTHIVRARLWLKSQLAPDTPR